MFLYIPILLIHHHILLLILHIPLFSRLRQPRDPRILHLHIVLTPLRHLQRLTVLPLLALILQVLPTLFDLFQQLFLERE